MGTGLIFDAAAEKCGRWTVVRQAGPAADLFNLDRSMAFVAPTVRVLTVSAPTLVLGSSQSADTIDGQRAADDGIDVVRRRSGGGTVFLSSDMLWVDVFVPGGDPLWNADIGRSMWWIGQAWADALTEAAVEDVVVHRGAMVTNPWSSLVCFSGLGPGEVTIAGRKVVGISQRRNRTGALLQCGVVRRWTSWFVEYLDRDLVLECNRRGGVRPEDAGVGVGAAADEALDYFLADLR